MKRIVAELRRLVRRSWRSAPCCQQESERERRLPHIYQPRGRIVIVIVFDWIVVGLHAMVGVPETVTE